MLIETSIHGTDRLLVGTGTREMAASTGAG